MYSLFFWHNRARWHGRGKCQVLLIAVLLVLAVLILALLYSKAYLEIKFERRGTDDRITIIIKSPLGVVYQRTEVPVLEFDRGRDGWRFAMETTAKEDAGDASTVHGRTELYLQELDKVRVLLRRAKEIGQTLSPVVDFILDHVTVSALSWQTALGTKDAAVTAMLCGSLWGLKGSLLGYLERRVRICSDAVVIAVYPNFKQASFQTFLQCIFSLRVVHIITAQLILFREKRRHKKGVNRDG
jgi:hypothetical protein